MLGTQHSQQARSSPPQPHVTLCTPAARGRDRSAQRAKPDNLTLPIPGPRDDALCQRQTRTEEEQPMGSRLQLLPKAGFKDSVLGLPPLQCQRGESPKPKQPFPHNPQVLASPLWRCRAGRGRQGEERGAPGCSHAPVSKDLGPPGVAMLEKYGQGKA